MSEEKDRNYERIAPEAAESEKSENQHETLNESPNEVAADAKAVAAEADAPEARKSGAPEGEKKKGGKKKRKKRGAVLPLVIALVVALVIFGVLVGYGLGRIRAQKAESGEEQPGAEATQEVPAYDAFTEALTQENQQALDALAGADEAVDPTTSDLMSEEGFFTDDEDAAGDEAIEGEAEVETEPVVVAEYGDGKTLMSDEVLEEYNEQLSSYIFSGYSEEEVAETLLDDVLHSMVSARVEAEHAEQMGLNELSDEDRAQIEEQARANYEEYLQFYREAGIAAEGKSEEEIESEAEAALLENEGISYDSLVEQIEADWWERKLYDELTGSVTVDDADVRAAYDARVEEQKENFAEYPDDFEFGQRNGEVILYNPPGYRAFKLLLLGFDDEEAAMSVYTIMDELYADEESDAAATAERQAELDGYYAGPEVRAREALSQLRGGADMDEMIVSIGQDEGMLNDQLRAQGYYICADSMLWPEEVVDAAMALENVGDFSEPVRTEDGVCILQYLGEVSEGEVPFEDVRDALREELLTTAKDEAFQAQVQAWVDEAKPSYYPERIQ